MTGVEGCRSIIESLPKNKVWLIADVTENTDPEKINLLVKIIRKFQPKEFTREDGSKGIVMSFLVADCSGISRLVVWNADVWKYNEFNVGDVVKVIKPIPKQSKNGIELHVGFVTRVMKIDDPELDERYSTLPENVPQVVQTRYERMNIGEIVETLSEDENKILRVEVIGTVAKVYRVVPYHSSKKNKDGIILSVGLDDGTGSIKAFLYDEVAEEFMGLSKEEVMEEINSASSEDTKTQEGENVIPENVMKNVGKEYVVRGIAKVIEMINGVKVPVVKVSEIELPNYEELIKSVGEVIKNE